MNVNRRSFLRALFAGAPAVVLAAPDVVRLLAAAEAGEPGPALETWQDLRGSCAWRPAGRHVVARAKGPCVIGAHGGRFEPGPDGGWLPWELELAGGRPFRIYHGFFIAPNSGSCWYAPPDQRIIVPAGGLLELAAMTRAPGLLGGWIA